MANGQITERSKLKGMRKEQTALSTIARDYNKGRTSNAYLVPVKLENEL